MVHPLCSNGGISRWPVAALQIRAGKSFHTDTTGFSCGRKTAVRTSLMCVNVQMISSLLRFRRSTAEAAEAVGSHSSSGLKQTSSTISLWCNDAHTGDPVLFETCGCSYGSPHTNREGPSRIDYCSTITWAVSDLVNFRTSFRTE